MKMDSGTGSSVSTCKLLNNLKKCFCYDMFFARDASNTNNKIAVMCDICKKTSKVSFSCFNVMIFKTSTAKFL